jgi:branched-chain amino acid transport system substrate-binding protein
MSHSANEKQSRISRILSSTWHFFNENVLMQVVTAILSLVIVARITNWWTGPQTYRVYVAGSFNPYEETTQEVWNGFSQKSDSLGSIDGINVVIGRANDSGNPDEAAKVASDLAQRNDTLMVVGHLLSSQSKAALPIYLQNIAEPVPVILATETNPELIPANLPDENPFPVFRFSPTDDKQAAKAADFAVERLHADRFWIVKDSDNLTYSEYLVKEFQQQVAKAGKHVIMITTSDSLPNLDVLNKSSVQCVFFAGDETHAMTLIDQIESIQWASRPRIMLSDWSVGPRLIPKEGKAVEGVYLFHPLSANVYNSAQYTWYGSQAREVVEHLVRDADSRFSQTLSNKEPVSYFFKKLLNIHRVGDARTAIGAIMSERHSYQTPSLTYAFDHDGASSTSEFHIWQIQKQKFVECQHDNCK